MILRNPEDIGNEFYRSLSQNNYNSVINRLDLR